MKFFGGRASCTQFLLYTLLLTTREEAKDKNVKRKVRGKDELEKK